MPAKPKFKPGSTEVQVKLRRHHVGQQRIADDPARFKVVMCGRRFGKTAYGVREAENAAIAGHPVGVFAPTYKYQLEVWRQLLADLQPLISRSHDQERRIELVTGGVIELWTLDTPDPGLGRKYKLAVIDEAGIVPDLLLIWQRAIRPTLVDLVGEGIFLGTPRGRRHGFVTLFNRGLDKADSDWKDWQSFRARTLDNPYIDPAEVESARRELTPEVFAQEFEAIPTDDGANPFGIEAIRASIGPLSTDPTVCYGLDLARSLDYTVLTGLDAYRRTTMLDRWQASWSETKARVKATVGELPVVADATGVGDAIVGDLQQMGVAVTPHVFTQPSKLRLMQRLVAAFQGKELTIPEGWLTGELEAFEFTYSATGTRYEAPSGCHDDGVMALALALHGWDRVQGAIPEAPPGLRVVRDDPYFDTENAIRTASVTGDFTSQFSSDLW